MKKIRITSVPTGQAPEEVRKQWVGVEIPIVMEGVTGTRGVLGGKGSPEHQGGYAVNTKDAITALHEKGCNQAADWWQDWYHTGGYTQLVFGKQFCEVVP